MKNIKRISTILLFMLCLSIFGVGVYAAVDKSNSMSGDVQITATTKYEVNIEAWQELEDGTKQHYQKFERVRDGQTLSFSDLVVSLADVTSKDQIKPLKLAVKVTNLTDIDLGAYFLSEGVDDAPEVVKTTDINTGLPLVDTISGKTIFDVDIDFYQQMSPSSSGNSDEALFYVVFTPQDLFYGNYEFDFNYKFVIESYNPNVTSNSANLSSFSNNSLIKISSTLGTSASLLSEISSSGAVASPMSNIAYAESQETPRTSITSSLGLHTNSTLQNISIIVPKTVTTIETSAFANFKGLKHVGLPASVTKIGSSAFKGCTGLTNIYLIDELTQIGSEAFSGCTGFTEVTIPETVTSIGSSAFYGCSGMLKLTINCNSVTIGTSAFEGLVYLETLNFNAKSNNFTESTASFIGLGYSGSGVKVTFGEKVTKVPNYLFFGSNDNPTNSIPAKQKIPKIIEVNFSDSVTTIGQYAFRQAWAISYFEIPDSVTKIEDYAFKGATIDTLKLGKNISEIGKQAFGWMQFLRVIEYNCEALETFGGQSFAACGTKNVSWHTGLVPDGTIKIIVGQDVVTIPNSLFKSGGVFTTTVIKSVDLSSATSLQTISTLSFANQASLTSVLFPEQEIEIASDAFSGCGFKLSNTYNNGTYKANGSNPYYKLIGVTTTTMTSFTIHPDCEIIDDEVFNGCSKLTSINIPSKVRIIGRNAFANCSALKTLTIPASVMTMGSYAFTNCTALTTINYNAVNCADFLETDRPFYNTRGKNITVNVGEGVERIPAYLFYAVSNTYVPTISVLNLPNTLKEIGAYAFRHCQYLTSLNIPNSVEKIGECAFKGGINISTFTLGENVKVIEKEAFGYFYKVETMYYNAIALETVVTNSFAQMGGQQTSTNNCKIIFGENVESIPSNCFASAAYYRVGEFDFSGAKSLKTIHKEAFKNFTSQICDKIVLSNSLTHVGANAFNGSCFKEITIGTKFSSADAKAFYGMQKLEKVYYNAINGPDVTASGYDSLVFYETGIDGGYEVVIGKNVLTMPYRLFHTANIKKVSYEQGSSLKVLEGFAFYNNPQLVEITLPDSLEKIDKCALSYCRDLVALNIPKNVSHIGLTNTQFLDSLTSLTVDPENPYFYSSGNCIIERVTKTLVAGCNVSVIPQNEGILTIAECAFCRCDKLTSVTIPSTVTSIQVGAFEYSGLTSIEIPANVTSVEGCLNDCKNLTSITVNSNNQTLYSQGNCIIEKATKKILVATSISTIPTDIKVIGKWSFLKYGGSEVKINTSVTEVQEEAFLSSSHKTVYINNSSILALIEDASSCGGLISSKVKTVYIKSSHSAPSYITSNFTKASGPTTVAGVVYAKYTR